MESKEEARSILNHILIEWDHFSTHLQNIKGEELVDKGDLYSQIDFLSQLDEMKATISSQLIQLEKHMKDIESSDSFKEEAEKTLKHLQPKLQIAEESFGEIAEEVLSRCQDRINELTGKILEHRQRALSLKEKTGLKIDEENELRDLLDSLEAYREVRLENLADEIDDPIIDQLDSQMISCDSALLIDESSL